MKLARLVAVLAAVLASASIGIAPASATTVDECQSQLVSLQTNTANAGLSVTKLETTATKLAGGKDADAVAKLTDFVATLDALATSPKPKVDAAVADALAAEAEGVIGCINAIDTP